MSALSLHHERMSGAFEKWHVHGLPIAAALHHFTEPDHGDPHDHPFRFTSFVLAGGYVERVYRLDGSSELIHRRPGEIFTIDATHIHRIVGLPAGECWTMILAGPHVRVSRFWQFREDGVWSRAWHEHEFSKHQAEPQS